MRYSHFRSCGLFVGSGVVEADYKTVIGQRLKQSGMHWSVPGAAGLLTLAASTPADARKKSGNDQTTRRSPRPRQQGKLILPTTKLTHTHVRPLDAMRWL